MITIITGNDQIKVENVFNLQKTLHSHIQCVYEFKDEFFTTLKYQVEQFVLNDKSHGKMLFCKTYNPTVLQLFRAYARKHKIDLEFICYTDNEIIKAVIEEGKVIESDKLAQISEVLIEPLDDIYIGNL